MRRKLVAGTVALVVLAGAGTLAVMAGRRTVKPPVVLAGGSSVAPGTQRGTTPGPGEFRDEKAGFALSYPSGWKRLETTDEQVVLVAAENEVTENQGGSILVRVIQLGAPVGRDQLAEARKVTDATVTSGQGTELKAQPTEITQGGLPGYFYFYTFTDPASGQRGAHSHYFLFNGQTMITMVFQAVPEADFVRLAPTFDQVASSFHLLGTAGGAPPG
jgi:hypothetical protein